MTMSLASATIETLAGVRAELNYLASTIERPSTYTFGPPPGTARSTVVNEPHLVHISDARPILGNVSLDEEGFGLVRDESAVRNFYNEQEVRSLYYPEAESILKEEPAPIGSLSSITRSAVASRAVRIGVPMRRGSRFLESMLITRRNPARSGSGISYRTRRRSCCVGVCKSSTSGGRSADPCGTHP
jgi:hypothetical protein